MAWATSLARTTVDGLRNRVQLARLRRALAPNPSIPIVRLGNSYGGWVIPIELVNSSSIVYSGGVGEDVSFDLALIDRTGCEVWAFDPTPRSIEFARQIQNERFHFLPLGLWSSDGPRRFYAPSDPRHVSHSTLPRAADAPVFEGECKSLETIMRDLGHDRIDLLKLDVEGAEYEVLQSLTTWPRCICVELHPVLPLGEIIEFVRELGYVVIHVEGWNVTLSRI